MEINAGRLRLEKDDSKKEIVDSGHKQGIIEAPKYGYNQLLALAHIYEVVNGYDGWLDFTPADQICLRRCVETYPYGDVGLFAKGYYKALWEYYEGMKGKL